MKAAVVGLITYRSKVHELEHLLLAFSGTTFLSTDSLSWCLYSVEGSHADMYKLFLSMWFVMIQEGALQTWWILLLFGINILFQTCFPRLSLKFRREQNYWHIRVTMAFDAAEPNVDQKAIKDKLILVLAFWEVSCWAEPHSMIPRLRAWAFECQSGEMKDCCWSSLNSHNPITVALISASVYTSAWRYLLLSARSRPMSRNRLACFTSICELHAAQSAFHYSSSVMPLLNGSSCNYKTAGLLNLELTVDLNCLPTSWAAKQQLDLQAESANATQAEDQVGIWCMLMMLGSNWSSWSWADKCLLHKGRTLICRPLGMHLTSDICSIGHSLFRSCITKRQAEPLFDLQFKVNHVASS